MQTWSYYLVIQLTHILALTIFGDAVETGVIADGSISKGESPQLLPLVLLLSCNHPPPVPLLLVAHPPQPLPRHPSLSSYHFSLIIASVTFLTNFI